MELQGIEGTLVPLLKFGLVLVMLGGGVLVFRELIPMARGKRSQRVEPQEEQN